VEETAAEHLVFAAILSPEFYWRIFMPNTETIFGDSRQTNTVRPGQPGERRKGPVKKNGKGLIVGTTMCVVALAGVGIFFLAPKKSAGLYRLKTWNEAEVTSRTIANTVSATGVIELKNKETILSPQTARVSAVYAAEGDMVRKGQAIAQLVTDDLEWELVKSQAAYDEALRSAKKDDTSYEFSIRQQDISIKTAERNLANAKDNLEQTQGLFERNIASSSELSSAKNAVADASDSLELAKLNREQTVTQYELALTNRATDLAQKIKTIEDLKQSIADCTIRSGTNGKVYSLAVAVGDRVNSYATVAVVADPSDIQVGIDVAENRIGEVKAGNPVTVTIGDTAVKGSVTNIASSATTSSSSSASTVRVTADFSAVPPNAIVGGSVSTEIQVGIIENALVLPRGPYLSSGNYSNVYVISDNASAEKRAASFGISDGTVIQVVSGLEEGERIITSAYQEFIHLPTVSLAR